MITDIADIIKKPTPITLDAVTERKSRRIRGYIITLINDHDSTIAARKCVQSISASKSSIDPFIYPAVNPKNLDVIMEGYFGKSVLSNARYTYPKTESENRFDIKTGLQLNAYKTAVIEKRISCFMSHYVLWNECVALDEPIIIMEHDSLFVNTLKWDAIKNFNGNILGLNDPRGATRKSIEYDKIIKDQWEARKNKQGNAVLVFDAPWIDKQMIPQGIAGNSAYVIRPAGAEKLITLTAEHGIWPNDAIMCKQLMPGELKQIYPYMTRVQRGKSTTSE